MVAIYIHKRGNKYVYRRRVPSDFAHIDQRKEVKISLKTSEYQEALVRSAIYNEQLETFWSTALKSGGKDGIQSQYKNAVQIARLHGFTYKQVDQIANESIEEIVKRLSVDLNSNETVEAVLGGAGDNTLKLSDCTELYWGLIHDRLFNKSEHQIRKWKNPRAAAMSNFIEVIGDKLIHEVTRSDVLAFRQWWNERLREGMSPISANKQFRFIRDMLQSVSLNNEIDIDCDALFVKVNFRNNNNSRPPFEASFVQNRLLKGLGTLNERDRHVIMAIADTGARISEIFGLLPDDIKLNDDIPHIFIRPRKGYSLKTKSSERKIPLVGSALIAFKKFPDGFNHKGNPDTFSNTVNKFMKENGLRPTKQHSIYSLRHTFKDRLRDAEAPEEVIDELMGHKKGGPKYGRGHKLETKYKWLNLISYKL